MKRPRNVLMLYVRRHLLKVCMKILSGRKLSHLISRQELQIQENLKQMNLPI